MVGRYEGSNGTSFRYEGGLNGYFYITPDVSGYDFVFPGKDIKEFMKAYVERFYTASVAADILGVSAQWVTYLARNGEVPGIKTPLGWLFDPEDVKTLARQRRASKQQVSAI